MAKQTMGNIAYTGSIDFGSSSMYGDLERKGGMVMSNRPYTSDMSGMVDVIGAQMEEMKKDAKDAKDAKHAAAAIKIDARIEKVLKAPYGPAYASASTTKNKPKFIDHTMTLLFGLASDDGIGGMVDNVATATTEFGGLAQLQRAMVRRLSERSSYMNRGWFSRLLSGEKRVDELTTEEFKKLVDAMPKSDRKGSDLEKKPAKDAPVEMIKTSTGFLPSGERAMAMSNAAITGADIYTAGHMNHSGERGEAMGNVAITGAGDYRRGSGRTVHVGMADIIGQEHASAAARMDERIAGLLKPYWSALYRVATMGNEVERKCAANSLMLAMLSEEGLSGMVKSQADVVKQFESIGFLQRAMGRRLKECCGGRSYTMGADLVVSGDDLVVSGGMHTMGVDLLTSGDDIAVQGMCSCSGGCLCE